MRRTTALLAWRQAGNMSYHTSPHLNPPLLSSHPLPPPQYTSTSPRHHLVTIASPPIGQLTADRRPPPAAYRHQHGTSAIPQLFQARKLVGPRFRSRPSLSSFRTSLGSMAAPSSKTHAGVASAQGVAPGDSMSIYNELLLSSEDEATTGTGAAPAPVTPMEVKAEAPSDAEASAVLVALPRL